MNCKQGGDGSEQELPGAGVNLAAGVPVTEAGVESAQDVGNGRRLSSMYLVTGGLTVTEPITRLTETVRRFQNSEQDLKW